MEFIMGTRKMIKGFEQALYNLKLGQTVLVTVKSEYAYGKIGQPSDIGPDEDLYFRIAVTEVGEPDENLVFQSLSDEKKLDQIKGLKEQGNQQFKAGNLPEAIEIYKQAVEGILKLQRISQEARDFLKTLFVNIAVVSNKQEKWEDVITYSARVLDLDPKHIKALYYKATA